MQQDSATSAPTTTVQTVQQRHCCDGMSKMTKIESNEQPLRKTTTSDSDLPPPKRPRSAYNFFFQEERAKILGLKISHDYPRDGGEPSNKKRRIHRKTDGMIGFKGLTKLVGNKWKSLDAKGKEKYNKLYEQDWIRYEREMEIYKGKLGASMFQRRHLFAAQRELGESYSSRRSSSTASSSCSSNQGDCKNDDDSLVGCLQVAFDITKVKRETAQDVAGIEGNVQLTTYRTSDGKKHLGHVRSNESFYTKVAACADIAGWDIAPVTMDEMMKSSIQEIEGELERTLGGERGIHLLCQILDDNSNQTPDRRAAYACTIQHPRLYPERMFIEHRLNY